MYAFALHDVRARRSATGRDPLGMKPLYCHEGSSGVRFASEIKALLALLPQQPDLNPTALVQYMEAQHPLARDTPFCGIEAILPGEAVLIRAGQCVERWRHWSVVRTAPMRHADPISSLRCLMEGVFTQHQRADVPIGLFLSGGVDSTVLLGLMRRYGMEDIHTFSIGFPGSSVGDELDVATRLATHFGTQPSRDHAHARRPY